MAIVKPKNYTVFDMYKAWLEIKMKEGIYRTEHDKHIMKKGIRNLIDLETGKIVMNYSLFRTIIETHNKEVSNMLIEGWKFRFGFNLGYLQAEKHERNFNKPKVNIPGTMQIRRVDPTHPAIYFTDDHYCKIEWTKFRRAKDDLYCFYSFVPAQKTLKERFSAAIKTNPLLKSNYKFVPFIKVKLAKTA